MLAIIVPYYKLSFFENTLGSLEKQSDKRFKVYIGDDNSPEDCSSLLEKYKEKIDFTYYRFENNLGGTNLVLQWERCINMASHEEWIMILGDDDVLGNDVVAKFYDNIDDVNLNKINVVRFSTQCINDKGEFVSKIYENDKISRSSKLFVDKLNGYSRASLSEHVFRKSAYIKYGFKRYNMAWHSDDMAWLEFSDFKNIFCINTAKIDIRISDLSITGSDDKLNDKLESSYRFYKELLQNYRTEFTKLDIDLILRIFEIRLLKVEGVTFKGYLKILQLYLKYNVSINVFRFSYRFYFKKDRSRILG